jgi:hypothetical protein
MVRSTMYVAVWMVLGAVAPAWAQECSDTYDATAISFRGVAQLSFLFEEPASMTSLQSGGLAITSEGGTITLPELGGTWLATDRCQFSAWTVATSATGRASGSGVTFGEQLIGVVTVRGTGGTSGTFLVIGEAAEVDEPSTEPSTEETVTAAAAPAPTPARRRAR